MNQENNASVEAVGVCSDCGRFVFARGDILVDAVIHYHDGTLEHDTCLAQEISRIKSEYKI